MRVGFEPTGPFRGKTLSRRPRYDHFGTSPIALFYHILGFFQKKKPCGADEWCGRNEGRELIFPRREIFLAESTLTTAAAAGIAAFE